MKRIGLTPTQLLALDFLRSSDANWSDYCARNNLGAFGSDRARQDVRFPAQGYDSLIRHGLTKTVNGRIVANELEIAARVKN